jgi:hypothetical protein
MGVGNAFIWSSHTDQSSADSTYVAIKSGHIQNIAISTEDKEDNNFFVQIVKGAIKGNPTAPFQGGSQVGVDIEKPSGVAAADLDKVYLDLPTLLSDPFTFAAGDRISVYVKKGTDGTGLATQPSITLYAKYD